MLKLLLLPGAGSWPTARAWLAQFPGSKLGVTAAVTDRRSHAVHQWVRQVSLRARNAPPQLPMSQVSMQSILLETDAPYFLPSGVQRQVALPGDVAHVACQVAALKGLAVEEVLAANLASVQQVYGVRLARE